MECEEIKNSLFDFCEQNGSGRLNDMLLKHIASCKECASFYKGLINDFEKIELEKQSELNPYFTTKTLQKISQQNKPVDTNRVFLKTSVYATSVLLFGILTGVLINSFDLTVSETPVEQTTTVDETQTESATISDNATLTLNDW